MDQLCFLAAGVWTISDQNAILGKASTNVVRGLGQNCFEYRNDESLT